MEWKVEFSAEFGGWYRRLDQETQDRIIAAVRLLRSEGPGLGRPFVDSVRDSRHSNMKELRVGTVRILFAFDPKRTAILLVGGDKRGRWRSWYRGAIRKADRI